MKSMIYYVEDDNNIRELVVYALKSSGFDAGRLLIAAKRFSGKCAVSCQS